MLIDLMTATGSSLDAAGEIHGKPRWMGESDEAYRKRLIDETPADGGAAFGEFKQAGDLAIKVGGISVRDYFAASATDGDILDLRHEHYINNGANLDFAPLTRSQARYMLADAMLAERAK